MYPSLPASPPDAVAGGMHGALRDAEVREPRDAVGADEDVVRRDVAMNDRQLRAVVAAKLVGGVRPAHASSTIRVAARADAALSRRSASATPST